MVVYRKLRRWMKASWWEASDEAIIELLNYIDPILGNTTYPRHDDHRNDGDEQADASLLAQMMQLCICGLIKLVNFL